ncbi:MAG: hypothetical protein AAFX80_10575, partial [Cyanobacteria bacterium J06639_18]
IIRIYESQDLSKIVHLCVQVHHEIVFPINDKAVDVEFLGMQNAKFCTKVELFCLNLVIHKF